MVDVSGAAIPPIGDRYSMGRWRKDDILEALQVLRRNK